MCCEFYVVLFFYPIEWEVKWSEAQISEVKLSEVNWGEVKWSAVKAYTIIFSNCVEMGLLHSN
jgi:hypothetical protein